MTVKMNLSSICPCSSTISSEGSIFNYSSKKSFQKIMNFYNLSFLKFCCMFNIIFNPFFLYICLLKYLFQRLKTKIIKSMYILCLSGCLGVCFFLYSMNVKTTEPIGSIFFCGTSRDARKGL